MAYPSTSNNLPANHAATQTITSVNADAVEVDINELTKKLGTGTSPPTTVGQVLTVTAAGATAYQAPSGSGVDLTAANQTKVGVFTAPVVNTAVPFTNFKGIFGTPMVRGHIPHAAQLTKGAIAGKYNWPTVVKALAEATTSLAVLYPTGFTVAGVEYRIPAGIYREQIPFASADGVRLYAMGDVAVTTFDRWDIGANTWGAAASPNAATSFVSSLTVPTFTVDGDNPGQNFITDTTKALPEQVMVDGVMFNRVTAGSTLAAGQFMLDGSRHVVLRTGDGLITGHKIEVSMRSNICYPASGGTNLVLDGMYLYGGPSGDDTNEPLQQNNQAGFTIKNCMIGWTHGIAVAGGGAAGFKAIDNVFHNCGSIAMDVSGSASVIAGNIAFNCGGTQNTYSGALDPTGYSPAWGSGFCKAITDYSTMHENICWNMGMAPYWQDVWCRYGTVYNNVAWDCNGYIQIEVSSYFKVYGNHLFQTSANQFASTATNAIYISSSRDGRVGPDLSAGEEPNVVMRLATAYKLGWQTTRTDLPPSPGFNNAGSGGFKRVLLVDNVAILRKTGGQGPGGPDLAIQWSDISGSGQSCISDASNSGAHMMIGFENATDNVTGMTWPDDYIFLSDVTGLTGQQTGGWFMNVAQWNAIRWDAWTDPVTGINRKSVYLTYAEQAAYLNMYGLSQTN